MTANADATGAREALTGKQRIALLQFLDAGKRQAGAHNYEQWGYFGPGGWAYEELKALVNPPAPAPRKVRAEVSLTGGKLRVFWDEDGTVGMEHAEGYRTVFVTRQDLCDLAALDARADAEGFVVEGGEAGGPSAACGFDGATQLGSSSPNESPEATPSTAPPTPSASPEACDCGCNSVEDADGSECACDCHDPDAPNYREIPYASPEAGQSPSRAAQDTADGRVWWMIRHPQTSYGYVWDSEHGAWLGSGEAQRPTPVVPRSELARVQRERDEWEQAHRIDVATIQATADALYGDKRPAAWQTMMPSTVATLRAQLAAARCHYAQTLRRG